MESQSSNVCQKWGFWYWMLSRWALLDEKWRCREKDLKNWFHLLWQLLKLSLNCKNSPLSFPSQRAFSCGFLVAIAVVCNIIFSDFGDSYHSHPSSLRACFLSSILNNLWAGWKPPWQVQTAKISSVQEGEEEREEERKREEEELTTLISWMKASPKATSTFWVMFSTGLISLL